MSINRRILGCFCGNGITCMILSPSRLPVSPSGVPEKNSARSADHELPGFGAIVPETVPVTPSRRRAGALTACVEANVQPRILREVADDRVRPMVRQAVPGAQSR